MENNMRTCYARPDELWRTKARGTNENEYQMYLTFADDGNGIDFTTGKQLKTYDEWLNS
jgi:IS30 family transposase